MVDHLGETWAGKPADFARTPPTQTVAFVKGRNGSGKSTYLEKLKEELRHPLDQEQDPDAPRREPEIVLEFDGGQEKHLKLSLAHQLYRLAKELDGPNLDPASRAELRWLRVQLHPLRRLYVNLLARRRALVNTLDIMAGTGDRIRGKLRWTTVSAGGLGALVVGLAMKLGLSFPAVAAAAGGVALALGLTGMRQVQEERREYLETVSLTEAFIRAHHALGRRISVIVHDPDEDEDWKAIVQLSREGLHTKRGDDERLFGKVQFYVEVGEHGLVQFQEAGGDLDDVDVRTAGQRSHRELAEMLVNDLANARLGIRDHNAAASVLKYADGNLGRYTYLTEALITAHRAAPGHRITQSNVESALEQIYWRNNSGYEKAFDRLAKDGDAVGVAAQSLLVAMARNRKDRAVPGPGADPAWWGASWAEQVHMRAALLRLVRGGLVREERDPEGRSQVKIDDLLLARWIEKNRQVERAPLRAATSEPQTRPVGGGLITDERSSAEKAFVRSTPEQQAVLSELSLIKPHSVRVFDDRTLHAIDELAERRLLTYAPTSRRGVGTVAFADDGVVNADGDTLRAVARDAVRQHGSPKLPWWTEEPVVGAVGPAGQLKKETLKKHAREFQREKGLWLELVPHAEEPKDATKSRFKFANLLADEINKDGLDWARGLQGPRRGRGASRPRRELSALVERLPQTLPERVINRVAYEVLGVRRGPYTETLVWDLKHGRATPWKAVKALAEMSLEEAQRTGRKEPRPILFSVPDMNIASSAFKHEVSMLAESIADENYRRRVNGIAPLPIQLVVAGPNAVLDGSYGQVDFGPRSRDELIDLLDERFPALPLDEEAKRLVAAAAHGMPARLVEYAKDLAMRPNAGRYLRADDARDSIERVQTRLARRDQLAEKIGNLSPGARVLLDKVHQQNHRGLPRLEPDKGFDQAWRELIDSQLVMKVRPIGRQERLRIDPMVERLLEGEGLTTDRFVHEWASLDSNGTAPSVHQRTLMWLVEQGARVPLDPAMWDELARELGYGVDPMPVLEDLEVLGLLTITATGKHTVAISVDPGLPDWLAASGRMRRRDPADTSSGLVRVGPDDAMRQQWEAFSEPQREVLAAVLATHQEGLSATDPAVLDLDALRKVIITIIANRLGLGPDREEDRNLVAKLVSENLRPGSGYVPPRLGTRQPESVDPAFSADPDRLVDATLELIEESGRRRPDVPIPAAPPMRETLLIGIGQTLRQIGGVFTKRRDDALSLWPELITETSSRFSTHDTVLGLVDAGVLAEKHPGSPRQRYLIAKPELQDFLERTLHRQRHVGEAGVPHAGAYASPSRAAGGRHAKLPVNDRYIQDPLPEGTRDPFDLGTPS